MQVSQACDLKWACNSSSIENGAYYVARRQLPLRLPAQDKRLVQKLWEIVEVQTGTKV